MKECDVEWDVASLGARSWCVDTPLLRAPHDLLVTIALGTTQHGIYGSALVFEKRKRDSRLCQIDNVCRRRDNYTRL